MGGVDVRQVHMELDSALLAGRDRRELNTGRRSVQRGEFEADVVAHDEADPGPAEIRQSGHNDPHGDRSCGLE